MDDKLTKTQNENVVADNSVSNSDSDVLCANEVRKQKTNQKIFNVLLVVLAILLAFSLILRFFIGCRISVQGQSMEPNFHSGDVVWMNKRAEPQRGDVVVLFEQQLTVFQKIQSEFYYGSNSQKAAQYKKLIKRVVALGGDKLWVEQHDQGYVLVVKTADGKTLSEDYYTVGNQSALFYAGDKTVSVPRMTENSLGNLKNCTSEENAYEVPQGYFYFMGDNRNNSTDSRSLGALPISHIYGVVAD